MKKPKFSTNKNHQITKVGNKRGREEVGSTKLLTKWQFKFSPVNNEF
jgi:hypothetical protein